VLVVKRTERVRRYLGLVLVVVLLLLVALLAPTRIR